MPTQAYRTKLMPGCKSPAPARRAAVVQQIVDAAERMAKGGAAKRTREESTPYNERDGTRRTNVTTQQAESETVPVTVSGNEVAEQEAGFSLSADQYSQGIRLAVSDKDGLVRRCPSCNRRRLVVVPDKEGKRYIACADSLTAEPTCDYYSEV